MEEVVDATGANTSSRKVKRVPSAASGKDKEYQQQPSPLFSQSAGSESPQVNKVNKNGVHKRALPIPAVGLPSPDEDVLNLWANSAGQSNPSSSYSRSDHVSGQMGRENGIGVKEESDRGDVHPAESRGWHQALSSSGEGVDVSSMGRTGLNDEFQRTHGLQGKRGKKCKGGNMAMLSGRGLVRAVRGELGKAAAAAEAGKASTQVMLNSLALQQKSKLASATTCAQARALEASTQAYAQLLSRK